MGLPPGINYPTARGWPVGSLPGLYLLDFGLNEASKLTAGERRAEVLEKLKALG